MSESNEKRQRDEILKRMLNTPPKPKGGKPKNKPKPKMEKPDGKKADH